MPVRSASSRSTSTSAPWRVPLSAALTAAGGGPLLDVITSRPPRAFGGGEPYEGVAIGGALLFLLLLRVAAHCEREPWLVTAAIVNTLLVTYTARVVVIKFGIRAYRPGMPRRTRRT